MNIEVRKTHMQCVGTSPAVRAALALEAATRQEGLGGVRQTRGAQKRDSVGHAEIVRSIAVSLENAGLLARVGVDVHPDRQMVREPQAFDAMFEGKALRTSEDFREAYREARAFGKALSGRGSGGGFMTNLVEQRICSSIHAGLNTVRALLEGQTLREEEDEGDAELAVETGDEREALERLLNRLERIESDPKLAALLYYLDKEKWLELGVIIFDKDWRDCTAVLSRRDFAVLMTTAWSG